MKSIGIKLIKVTLAILLAFFVVKQVELNDRLLSPETENDQAKIELFGDLSGDWRGTDWTFHFAEGTPANPIPGATPYEALSATDLQTYLEKGWEIRPGFLTILSGIQLPWFVLGAALWGVLLVLASVRWRVLLRAVGIQTTFANALRLCFVGYFFNNVMPGVTGGDVVRGALITRGLESQRWRAALSVIVDRVVGLIALLTLAAIVLAWGLFSSNEQSRYPNVFGQGVFLVLAGAVLGGAVYLSRRVRDFLGVERWLSKLPGGTTLTKIDGALSVYRNNLKGLFVAYLMSLPLQICAVLSFWAIGVSIGAGISLEDDFVIFPVVQTASAIPLTPAGWGYGEWLYGNSFARFGSTFTLGVAVSFLFRLTTQLGFGLIGGLIWVSSGYRKEEVQLVQSEK